MNENHVYDMIIVGGPGKTSLGTCGAKGRAQLLPALRRPEGMPGRTVILRSD